MRGSGTRAGGETLLEGVLALLACQEGALPICIAHEQEQRIVQQVTEACSQRIAKILRSVHKRSCF